MADTARARAATQEHRAIFEAMAAGDAERAKALTADTSPMQKRVFSERNRHNGLQHRSHKIIKAHLRSGEMTPGSEIALKIDQTLT